MKGLHVTVVGSEQRMCNMNSGIMFEYNSNDDYPVHLAESRDELS